MLYGVDPKSFQEKELHEEAPLSKHAYSDASLKLIDKHNNGLVLDLGAGAKETALPNVVQLDIFRFPKTDIVARAEALPFKESVFDGVVSQAVFEHLQYPDLAVAEIQRVCKAGAEIKIDTAFLQPEHGYPNHFYNATLSGLKHWFRNFDIQWSGVEPYQHPCFALDWFLQVYLNAMQEKQKDLLQQASFPDFLTALDHLAGRKTGNQAISELASALWHIPEPVQRTIAAGVSLSAIATNKDSPKTSTQASSTIAVQAKIDRLEEDIQSIQFQSQCWQWLWEIQQSAMEVLYDHLQTRHHPLLLGTSRPIWRLARLSIITAIDQTKHALRRIKRTLSPYFHNKAANLNKSSIFLSSVPLSPPPLFQFVIVIEKKANPMLLLQCLCSLQKQNYSSWQCILQLNHGTSKIIQELAQGFTIRDNRFKLCDNPSENQSITRISDKKSKFFATIKPNTILLPHLLEEFASLAVAYPDKQAIQCRGMKIKKGETNFLHTTHRFTMTRDISKSIGSLPDESIGDINKILFLHQGENN